MLVSSALGFTGEETGSVELFDKANPPESGPINDPTFDPEPGDNLFHTSRYVQGTDQRGTYELTATIDDQVLTTQLEVTTSERLPSPPTNQDVEFNPGTDLTVTWDPVAGATHYELRAVQVIDPSNFRETTQLVTATTATVKHVPGELEIDHEYAPYHFEVTAYSSDPTELATRELQAAQLAFEAP